MQTIVNSQGRKAERRASAQGKKTARVRVQFFLDPADLDALRDAAPGRSDSERVRNFVCGRLPGDARPEVHSPSKKRQAPVPGATRRTTLRLPGFLLDELRVRADSNGMRPSWWLAGLIQSHLTGVPVLTTAELFGLREAARELSAIGRNLNQITRAVNEMALLSPHLRPALDVSVLQEISPRVDAVRGEIRKLVRASMRVWLDESEE